MQVQYYLLVSLVQGGPDVRLRPVPGVITAQDEAGAVEQLKIYFLNRLNQSSLSLKQSIKRVMLCKEKNTCVHFLCQIYPESS